MAAAAGALALVLLVAHVGQPYDPFPLMVLALINLACAIALSLLALSLIRRPAGKPETPWRPWLAAVALVVAVWAALLAVSLVSTYLTFYLDPLVASDPGLTRPSLDAFVAAATQGV